MVMPMNHFYHDLIEKLKIVRHEPHQKLLSTKQVRDLTVIELLGDLLLLVAVDSDGAIGPKEDDVVKVSGYECGRFGSRVPLLEILASGAVPVAAFDTLMVEMKPLGMEIIRGVRDELASAGLPVDFPLSRSTEDNVPTRQTGMGVVILGIVERKHLRPGSSKSKDEVICIGIAKSGPEDVVSLSDKDIADAKDILQCSMIDGVHDILPVGSKGILFEGTEMALSAGLEFHPNMVNSINLKKSAGPSTCFIVSAVSGSLEKVRQTVPKPVHYIGSLE